MLSRVATIVVPRLLTLMSAGQVNRERLRGASGDPPWAEPLQVTGVPNLYRVSAGLCRSGQPTVTGFRNLEALGFRSCMSLRAHRNDRMDARGIGVLCIWRPILGTIVTPGELEEAMLDLHYRLPKPVLVHCYQGSDRTGLIAAAYRILIEGWTAEQAVREMVLGGFGFHQVYHQYVNILLELNVPEMRARLQKYEAAHRRKGKQE